jgi:hypothetical protein
VSALHYAVGGLDELAALDFASLVALTALRVLQATVGGQAILSARGGRRMHRMVACRVAALSRRRVLTCVLLLHFRQPERSQGLIIKPSARLQSLTFLEPAQRPFRAQSANSVGLSSSEPFLVQCLLGSHDLVLIDTGRGSVAFLLCAGRSARSLLCRIALLRARWHCGNDGKHCDACEEEFLHGFLHFGVDGRPTHAC